MLSSTRGLLLICLIDLLAGCGGGGGSVSDGLATNQMPKAPPTSQNPSPAPPSQNPSPTPAASVPSNPPSANFLGYVSYYDGASSIVANCGIKNFGDYGCISTDLSGARFLGGPELTTGVFFSMTADLSNVPNVRALAYRTSTTPFPGSPVPPAPITEPPAENLPPPPVDPTPPPTPRPPRPTNTPRPPPPSGHWWAIYIPDGAVTFGPFDSLAECNADLIRRYGTTDVDKVCRFLEGR